MAKNDEALVRKLKGWIDYRTSHSNRRVNEPSEADFRRIITLATLGLKQAGED
jgi:hypothetical protein